MSGTPYEQWSYVSGGRYANTRAYAFDEDHQRHIATSNIPYLTQEPPRYLLPITQSHEVTLQSASQPRYSRHGQAWDNGSDYKYKAAQTNTGSSTHYSMQRPSLSRNTESGGSSTSYHDALGRGRGSASSVSRFNDVDSQYSGSSATFPSPVHSDKSPVIYPARASLPAYQQQLPIHQRHATAGVPSGFENLLHHSTTPSPPPQPPPRTFRSPSRYHLFIRQQPIAARACGAGDRDRRAVDPPPIIQILLTDFDPISEEDRATLQDPRFTVGCLLYPIHDLSRRKDPESAAPKSRNADRKESRTADLGLCLEDRNAPGQSTPLLSGKAFVSPFYVDEDPDPVTAPQHPSSTNTSPDTHTHIANLKHPTRRYTGAPSPATYFIFSDLSIRQAGLYRLQFRLMNWGSVEDTGQSMPILAEAWSEPFRVYPAKDFPGMRDSSLLTLRLKELGFVELKTRGKGIGKGRRAAHGKDKGDLE
ncbi:velvet factor family protein [Aspergillus stella-maris]|uniref:velvet factor family protein n=1 Tax=Aspergillus stella-maris TaxID=1810926 RepID=UPI003CCCB4B9